MVDIRYYLDADTGLPHIYGHGVTEDEVEYVLRTSREDFPARGNSRMRIGQTEAGRYLQIIYVPDEVGDGLFVVTAYDLTSTQKRAHRRRRRRRGK
jgi:hypothetical protein